MGDLGSIPRSGRSPGEGNGHPTSVFFPGKSHRWRNLVGCGPWGCGGSHGGGPWTRPSDFTHSLWLLYSEFLLYSRVSQPPVYTYPLSFGFPSLLLWASLVAQTVKNLSAIQETQFQSLGQEDSPGEGNGNSLQYSCLGNPMDRGAWWATVHGVTKSWT